MIAFTNLEQLAEVVHSIIMIMVSLLKFLAYLLLRVLILHIVVLFVSMLLSEVDYTEEDLTFYIKFMGLLQFLVLLRLSFLISITCALLSGPESFLCNYQDSLIDYAVQEAPLAGIWQPDYFINNILPFFLALRVSFFSTLLCEDEIKYIPRDNTFSLSKGIVALNRMYSSLDVKDPLKLFLDGNCKHLLKPLEGYTGIPITYANPATLIGLPNNLKLAVYT